MGGVKGKGKGKGKGGQGAGVQRSKDISNMYKNWMKRGQATPGGAGEGTRAWQARQGVPWGQTGCQGHALPRETRNMYVWRVLYK